MEITVRVTIPVGDARAPVVLVVSSDPERQSVMRRVLEGEGYGVICARHPGQALVASVRHRGPVDVVLADGADGTGSPELPASLFRDRPALKVVRVDAVPQTREALLDSVRAALSNPG